MTWRTAGSVMPQATRPSSTMAARWGAKVSPAGMSGVKDGERAGFVAAGDSVQAVLKAAAMAVRSKRVMRLGRFGYGFILSVGRRVWLATMAARMGLGVMAACPWLKYIRVVKRDGDRARDVTMREL
jgi:hypothetical protein